MRLMQHLEHLKGKKQRAWIIIPNEAWIFGGVKLRKRLICVLGKLWEGDGFPDDWRTGLIVPLYNKGEVKEEKNYRGITLMPSAYKVYTEILHRKLAKEIVDKKIFPDGQAGFRKGRSTIDNVYILNYIIQRSKKSKDKVYTAFIDLKAAFNTIVRETLWVLMKDAGISDYLIERIKETYENTKVRVRINEEKTEEFWTMKDLKQGWILSPILFCIYIALLETEFRKRKIGGIKIGDNRIWSLAYADGIVLITVSRGAIIDILGTLKRFLEESSF